MPEYAPTLIRTRNKQEFTETASHLIWDALKKIKRPLVVFPTGTTPLNIYRYLIKHNSNKTSIWQNMTYIALDEYAGLPPADERLFQNWIAREFLDPLAIPTQNRITFDSAALAPDQETTNREQWLKQNGPIDIAVLGLGTNGHIAFNEPGSAFDSTTRLIRLSQETRQANAAYWGGGIDNVPQKAYTLGLETLSTAKHIILLVTGAHKAKALHKALNDPITPNLPASFLRKLPHVTIIADHEALGNKTGDNE